MMMMMMMMIKETWQELKAGTEGWRNASLLICLKWLALPAF
jgi:ACR3 family arsenite efflux pump ArsB